MPGHPQVAACAPYARSWALLSGDCGATPPFEPLLDGSQPLVHPAQLKPDGFESRCDSGLWGGRFQHVLMGLCGNADEHPTTLLGEYESFVAEYA